MAWQRAAARADLEGRDVLGVQVDGRRVALFRLPDGVFATSDACPHAGAPLSGGCVVDGFVECPMHFALFDIRTGAGDGATTACGVPTFAVRMDGDDIYVDLPSHEESAR